MPSSTLYSDLSRDLTSIEHVEGISMAGKRRATKRDAEPPRFDNLKLIKGIGPTVEKRLFDDGIYTYAHLAAFLPGDIAAKLMGLPGMSAKRIIREDWIGQASKLATKSTLLEVHQGFEPESVTPVPTEHTHPETRMEDPQNLAMELASKEQAEFEALSDSDIVDKHQAILEQTQPIELTPAVTPLEEPQKDTETIALMEQIHPATFTIELLLDEKNDVHSVHVVHVESQREKSWSSWPYTEILDFLSENVVLSNSSDEPTLAIAEEPEHVPALITDSEPQASIATQPVLVGTLHLRDIQLLTVGYSEPRRLLSHDQPFVAHLTLDLSEMTVPSNIPLNFRASIYAKSRGSRSGQTIGEAEGTIKPSNTVTINVEGNPLPEGTYRLAATVIVALPGMKLTPRPGTMAVIDAGPVQVY